MSHSLSSTPQLSSPSQATPRPQAVPSTKATRPPQDTPLTQAAPRREAAPEYAAPLRGGKPLPATPPPTKVRFTDETPRQSALGPSTSSPHKGTSTSGASSRRKSKVNHSNSHELPAMCFPRPYWQPDYRRIGPAGPYGFPPPPSLPIPPYVNPVPVPLCVDVPGPYPAVTVDATPLPPLAPLAPLRPAPVPVPYYAPATPYLPDGGPIYPRTVVSGNSSALQLPHLEDGYSYHIHSPTPTTTRIKKVWDGPSRYI